MTQNTTALTINFGGSLPPVKRPQGNGPLLQWFNGLPAGKTLAIGWHIQASRCSEALTEALRALKAERYTVLHKMSGEMVEYWHLESASLIVLCNGYSDPWEMQESGQEERDGLAYGWIESKSHSKVKVKVIVAELAAHGYTEPLVISLEGMITNEFFEALSQQFKVLDACEQITGQVAPFYGFSLLLTPAEKPKMVGGKGKQSPIVPMLAQVPTQIGEEYLAEHFIGIELLTIISERDLVAKAVKWSVDVSRRIAEGEDKEAWETPEYEAALDEPETPPATGKQLASIGKLCHILDNKPVPTGPLSFIEAKAMIGAMTQEFNAKQRNGGKTQSRAFL